MYPPLVMKFSQSLDLRQTDADSDTFILWTFLISFGFCSKSWLQSTLVTRCEDWKAEIENFLTGNTFLYNREKETSNRGPRSKSFNLLCWPYKSVSFIFSSFTNSCLLTTGKLFSHFEKSQYVYMNIRNATFKRTTNAYFLP